jgi:phosphatidylglycerophosphate synthase
MGPSVSDPPYTPERRPIAARDLTVSHRLAAWLAGLGVTPNTISGAGMLAGVASGAALAGTAQWPAAQVALFLAAAALAQLRLLANMLDGMVAVSTGQASPVGELYNEVPDRVSDAAILIGAGYAAGGRPELGYLAACLALFIAYVRAQGKVAGAHQEFCGPMAKQQRMFVVTLAAVYAAVAPAAWQPGWGVMAVALAVILVGGVVTVFRRVARIGRALREARP